MPFTDLFGWTAVAIGYTHPQWDRVRGCAAPAVEGIATPHQVDAWVNEFLTYAPDAADHWQTPAETLERGRGDCEDFAILKRAMLLAAGYRGDVMFVIVHDLISRRDHAILVADGLVLDCFNSRSLPVDQVRDYSPIMAFSGDMCWTFGRAV